MMVVRSSAWEGFRLMRPLDYTRLVLEIHEVHLFCLYLARQKTQISKSAYSPHSREPHQDVLQGEEIESYHGSTFLVFFLSCACMDFLAISCRLYSTSF